MSVPTARPTFDIVYFIYFKEVSSLLFIVLFMVFLVLFDDINFFVYDSVLNHDAAVRHTPQPAYAQWKG